MRWLPSIFALMCSFLIFWCAGERVLIHAAAGGVGQAAISICQYLGAEIYTTTSKVRDGHMH
jgi:NADPH:quinone reductase-like Zn-dependent oxidoreductase